MAKVQVTNVLDNSTNTNTNTSSRRSSFYKGVDVKKLDLSQVKARIADLKSQEAFAIEMEETNLAQRQWTCPYQTGHQLPVKLMLLPSA